MSFEDINQGLGIVLSGGGSRTAYQVGVLRALYPHLTIPKVVVGSSMGAVNGIVLGAGLGIGFEAALYELRGLWLKRTFKNTFRGSPSKTFLKTIQVAFLRYSNPGPFATSVAIFDPTPLSNDINSALGRFYNVHPLGEQRPVTAVMTTVEDKSRKGLLLVQTSNQLDLDSFQFCSYSVSVVPKLTAEHGLASAALPSVLPPVDLGLPDKKVRLIDGGIVDNVPVDSALRLGADRLITIDVSGRQWWFGKYGKTLDERPEWEIPADPSTFCLFPKRHIHIIPKVPFGKLLKCAVGKSSKEFLVSMGATWPIFRLLRHKMGEDFAYEVMSYVALHPEYFQALEELGYQEGLVLAEKIKAEI